MIILISMAATAITFTLVDRSQINYIDLLDKLIEKSLKTGECPNKSEFIRKLIVREAKKAGIMGSEIQ